MTTQEKVSTDKSRKPRSKKLPALHFYPGDWKKDLGVQSLEFVDRAVWFELLMLMHESEERGVLVLNGKPMTVETIARLINLDKQTLSKSLATIKEHGVCSVREDGAITCRRMLRDEEISLIRSDAGSKGGNPNLLNQNSSKTKPKRKQNTEDESVNENAIEIEDLKIKMVALGWGEKPQSALLRWIEHRKRKNKPLGPTEIEALISNWSHDLAGFCRAVNHHTENGNKNIYPVPEERPQKDTKFKTKTEQLENEIEGIFKL